MDRYLQYVVWAGLLLTAVVHLILALGVWTNASERERDQKPLMYVGAGGWAMATLLTGVLGLLSYWLIHHSALRKLYNKDGTPAHHE